MDEEKKVVVAESIKTSSFKERIKKFFKQKTLVLLLTIGCIIYALNDVIKWKINEADFWVLLLNLVIATFFTIYVVNILGKMGIKAGKESEIFLATMKRYGKKKEEIEPIRSHLSEYTRYKTEQDKIELQKIILDNDGLEYEKLYDYDITKLSKKEAQAVKKARKVKVTRLLEKDLVSERGYSAKAKFGTYLGKTEKDYEMQKSFTTLLSKLLIPIAITYIGIESVSMANLLGGLIKTTMILFSGLLNYVNSEDFAINELRNRFINKADALEEFKNMYENKKGCFAETDEPVEAEPVEEPNEPLLEACKKVDKEYTEEDITNAKSKEDLPFNTLPNTFSLEEKKQIIMALLDLADEKEAKNDQKNE